jgi:apolipoprotein N-acyltransferase
VATILCFGWRRALAAFVAGAASALAMAPFDLFPVLFATFPVLVWLMDSTVSDPARFAIFRLWNAFKTGWWFGFGYFLAGMWWIGDAFLVDADRFAWMLPFAVIALPAALAIFFGLGTAIARIFWKPDWRRLLALAVGLAAAEYLRGTILTGFPWNTIGYAALTLPATMQKASVLGLYGVTLVAIPVFSAGALLAAPPGVHRRRVALPVLLVLAAIGADFGFGYWRLGQLPTDTVENVSLRLVQPAIDQAEKWTPDLRERNFKLLLDMSRGETEEDKLKPGTVLVWPESAFPFILTERRDALAAIAELLPDGAVLIAGAVRLEPDETADGGQRAFNSVYLIDTEGVITGAADKLHLVPFGEYLPFQHMAERAGLMQLTHLHGGFVAGRERQLLDVGPAGMAAPLICYEIIFPGAIDSASERPTWLLNLTNDAWFGLTPGPYQHWRQAVVRGVEEGLPVVRVANSGISSVSDSGGRVISTLGLGRRGVVDARLPVPGPPTYFARHGNLAFLGVIGLLTALLLFPARVR